MACCQYRQRNSKQMWAPSSLYGNNQFLPIEVVLLPYMYTWPPARHKITCTNRCGRPPPYKGIIELIQCLSFFLPYMGIWHSAREYHVSKQMWAPSPKISIPIIMRLDSGVFLQLLIQHCTHYKFVIRLQVPK